MLREVAGGRNGRVAVIDVGSNSLRLVVYDGLGRAPAVLFNEKVLCGLGRGLASTGRLNPQGVALAIETLERFVALARAIGVSRLDVVATAAARDAEDGRTFVAEIERRCGVRVRILAGEEEGRLSALGVAAGIPAASGIMGDLGGGSVELVPLEAGEPGVSATLPIGPLRIAEFADNPRKLRDTVDGLIADLPTLAAGRGRSFYLVGGAWRALARIHMEHCAYPLHIIQHYEIPRFEAERFLDVISGQSRKSLEKIVGVSKKRLEVVPLAAFLLARLVRAIAPQRLVFSALGLREGLLQSAISAAERRRDPLLAACEKLAAANRRFGIDGYALADWVSPVLTIPDERTTRLIVAASLLSDTGWRVHPDYRAQEAFLAALRMPIGGLDHPERVFIATALHARYGGTADDPIRFDTRRLLAEDAAGLARALGLALRLAMTMTGGVPDFLPHARLAVDQGRVTLTIFDNHPALRGETVQRRLDALGKALGRATLVKTAPLPPEPRHRRAARA
jgi:exopolyphosphatase/guanosine-5'-triphosphate,3'-diphosphate pyrophosphatase